MRAFAHFSCTLLALGLVACSPQPASESWSSSHAPASEPAKLAPERAAPPAARAQPVADLPHKPRAEAVDLLTISEARARVVTVFAAGGPPCGRMHNVGAIEVELLELGQPAPHLGLYISCPSDLHPRGMLQVGKTLDLRFYKRKQSWPRPVNRPPQDLVVRDVSSIKLAAPNPLP